jgi:HEAT repeat protein
MGTAMGVLPLLADSLIERLQDEDHLVRVAAAEALQYCKASDVRNALVTAAGADKSIAVQNAAKNSLRSLGTDSRAAAAAAPKPVLAGKGDE